MKHNKHSGFDILIAKLKEKQLKSPGFSLRSLARQLKISPTTLSEGLKGKRNLSLQLLEKLSDRLELSSTESAFLISDNPCEFSYLDDNLKKTLNNWYTFAILNLVKSDNFTPNSTWISQKLDISPQDAEATWINLVKEGFVVKDGDKWKVIDSKIYIQRLAGSHINEQSQKDAKTLENTQKGLCLKEHTVFNGMTYVFSAAEYQRALILVEKLKIELSTLSIMGSEKKDSHIYRGIFHIIPVLNPNPKD